MKKLLVLSIACVLTAGAYSTAANDKIVENATKQSFDAVVAGAEAGRTLTCTGVGCRKKTMLGVKVYAIGHWIDARAAAEQMVSWKGKSAEQLVKDQGFYDALSAVDVEKRLRLVFVHDATGKQLRDSFEDSLENSSPSISGEIKTFLALFQSELKVGGTIELRWLPGGVIEVHENGKKLKAMDKNAAFATAVWNMYFGKKLADSRLETVKKELISNVAKLWQP